MYKFREHSTKCLLLLCSKLKEREAFQRGKTVKMVQMSDEQTEAGLEGCFQQTPRSTGFSAALLLNPLGLETLVRAASGSLPNEKQLQG